MISRILSPKYDYLDDKHKKKDRIKLSAKRSSAGDWPDLEAALFEFHQFLQNKKATITGDILKEKATQLWNALPQYQGIEMPKFSNGWLGGFKHRYKIREYVQHGEAGGAAVETPNAITQMNGVRELCSQYERRNILNMDETGLNWKQSPNRTLATQPQSGSKQNKDRITLVLTTDADGSQYYEPWVISRSKNPRCFKNINRRSLRVHYRYNKSKWMTGLICEEYLQWLDNKMRGEGRKVLLLMDNFSGHELGVILVGGLQGLTNVRITWLPPNTTSHWQPMDQGIIASFKLQYRKFWVAYMIRMYESNKNPTETVTLLKAIQWSRVAWEQMVTTSTIQRCWNKSTCVKAAVNQDLKDDSITQEADLERQLTVFPTPLDGEERLSLHEFLYPKSETIIDNDIDIFDSIVVHHSIEDDVIMEAEDSDGEEVEKVLTSEAEKAVETLKLWYLQQEETHESMQRALDQIGREVVAVKSQGKKQVTLDCFFTR